MSDEATQGMAVDADGKPARRVLLKLSGEAFGGGSVGLDADVVRRIARRSAWPCATASRSPSSSAAGTSSAAPS
nr:hypothetical protein GCM10025730_13930 [Promicromonospora thailandica]